VDIANRGADKATVDPCGEERRKRRRPGQTNRILQEY
jgi:hypothetical protein